MPATAAYGPSCGKDPSATQLGTRSQITATESWDREMTLPRIRKGRIPIHLLSCRATIMQLGPYAAVAGTFSLIISLVSIYLFFIAATKPLKTRKPLFKTATHLTPQ